MRISVLIADDEDTVRDTLAAIVAADPELELVGQAADAPTAIELASKEQPDVAILDVRMPGGGGPRAAREIIRRSPPTRVLALSAHEDVDSVLAMLRAGALGYVLKTESTEALLGAIHRCLDGRTALSGLATNDLAHALAEQLHHVAMSSRQDAQRQSRIRRVLERNRLGMVFQPIVDLDEDRVVGVEALARFYAAPRRAPDAWFAEAEAVGMLPELELAAVRMALSHLDQLPEDYDLSINISPATAATEDFREALSSAPLGRLVLEMTEQAPVDDYDALGASLSGLRADGVRLAIDDAGAGFSSLRHIAMLRPDLVKLDITLVHDLDHSESRHAVVAALTAFSSQIGAHVIGEGVETQAELEALRSIGVRFAQGFHLGRPGPIPPGGEWSVARPRAAAGRRGV